MSKEQVFTTYQKIIAVPKFSTPIVIQPIGDIHYNSPHCALDAFRADLAAMKRRHTPSTYYLMMGDEMELCSTREREILADRKMHTTTLTRLDQQAVQDHLKLLRDLKFMRGHLLGWVEGNHYWEFQSGDDRLGVLRGESSTRWMARQTESRWLGYLGYIRLLFRFGNTTQKASLDIVACHGRAGGKLVGTSINQVNDLRAVFPGADLYLFGHDHQRGGWPVTILTAGVSNGPRGQHDELHVRHRDQWLCRTGSYHRAYVPNEPSYPVGGLMRPSSLGSIRLTVTHHAATDQQGDRLLTRRIECAS